MPSWAPEEDATLRELYATHTRAQIAEVLGRTEGMVRSRCWTLGLASKLNQWTDEELAALREVYNSPPPIPLDAFSEKIGRHKTNVCRKARSLGLTDQGRRKVLERKPLPKPKYATSEERNLATSERIRKMWAEREHPRGFLGKKHSKDGCQAISRRAKAMWADPDSKVNAAAHRQRLSDNVVRQVMDGHRHRGYSRGKSGKRDDLNGLYVRSSWEANYARYLNFQVRRGDVLRWEYEPQTFEFKSIKRGTRTYTPDFKVYMPAGGYEWHEVKGWMDPKSKTRLKRMKLYYPEEPVIIIGKTWFDQARRGGLADVVEGWE